MGKALLVLFGLMAVLYAVVTGSHDPPTSQAPGDPHTGARGACMLFIERQQLEAASANWGDISSWAVVDNGDGTLSVGARYGVADRTRYTTCVLRKDGGEWRAVSLSRLR